MGLSLFQRSARKEADDSEFATTVASLPPGVEDPRAFDSQPPDSQPADSQPFDSQPFDSRPFDSRPFDSEPFDSQPFDSRPFDAGPEEPRPPDSETPDSRPPELSSSDAPEAGAPPARAVPGTSPRSDDAAPAGVVVASASYESPDAEAPTRESVADQPTTGQVGRYALKGRLGVGGLGQVHEAWDPLLSRALAIKTLQFESDPRQRASLDRMFLAEARAIANLSHPNIVTVYDAGLSDQGVYIAMERLHGRDLRQRLAEGWKPGPAVAAQLIRRVADALAYAHARGVVHCDIKPANIFITQRDKPKVLDFGIARVAHGRALPGLEGMVAGSPHYLAPEQLRNEEVDPRTDVYALGVVFYELLSSRRAFTGDSVEQITTAVLTNHPAPAHLIRQGIPEALSAIAAKAMSRDPAGRYATASDMALDIRAWFDRPPARKPSKQPPAGPAEVNVAELPSLPPPRPAPPRSEPRPQQRRWWIGGATLAVAALATTTVGLVARDRSSRAAPGVAPHPATAPTPAPANAASAAAPATDLMLVGGVPVMAPPAAAPPAEPPAASNPAASASAAVAGGAAPVAPASAPGGPTESPRASAAQAPLASPATPAPAAPTVPSARSGAKPAPAKEPPRPHARVDSRRSPPPAASTPAPAAPAATGTVQLAISPWGQVEVDGQSAGTTPPLARLTLTEGTHQITIRNADFPAHTLTVQVQADKPVTVRHRFGQ